jgi:hypothetical protein
MRVGPFCFTNMSEIPARGLEPQKMDGTVLLQLRLVHAVVMNVLYWNRPQTEGTQKATLSTFKIPRMRNFQSDRPKDTYTINTGASRCVQSIIKHDV